MPQSDFFGGLAQAIGAAQDRSFRKKQVEREEKNRADDKKRHDESDKKDNYEKGLLVDPKTGLISDSPERAEEKAYKKMQHKLDVELRRESLKQARKKEGPRQLPPDKVLQIQEGGQIPASLEDIKKSIDVNSGIMGPVEGRLRSMNPYDEKAQTMDAQMRTASQRFGRYLEGGVLRKEDEEKYRKMFPQMSDKAEVAANKLSLVERMLKQKQGADVGALEQSGYDTQAFQGAGQNVPDAPGILTGRKGLLPPPERSSAAPSVTPEDQAAIQWAKQNSGDPRAAQILQMHGAK